MLNTKRHTIRWYTGYGIFILMIILLLTPSLMARAEDPEVVDRIVAVVNDEIISLSELNRLLSPYEERIRTLGYTSEQEREMIYKVREDLLNQLIDQKLTAQESDRASITVSEAEIDAALERIKQQSSYTEEDMVTALEQEGSSMAEFREQLREKILRTKLVNQEVRSKIVITDEDIREYYEANQDEYGGEKQYQLRNILLTVPLYADSSEKETVEQRMAAVVEQFEAGKSFSELARQYSESPMAETGGELGSFALTDLTPQLQTALDGLEIGEITPILDTEQGYQVIYVEEIVQNPGRSLEEVTPEIEEKLYNEIVNEKVESWLSELRESAHIKIIR